jgi:hypothetical protein
VNQAQPVVRGRPFPKGNGGRKPGSKNRTTQIAAALLAGEEEKLVRIGIELALAGDATMLKFFLSSMLPRERSIKIDLPDATNGRLDPVEALAAIIGAVADGQISPSEGAALATLIESYRKASEYSELTRRMDALESKLAEPI